MLGKRNISEPDEGIQIDLSPMIDCVFLLLIFFIVTTTFVEETGVQVLKPELGAAAESLEKDSVLIAVTVDRQVVHGGKNIGVAGVQSVVREALKRQSDMPVIIQGDTNAPHGLVQQVHGECKLAGAAKVSVSAAT